MSPATQLYLKLGGALVVSLIIAGSLYGSVQPRRARH